MGFLILFMKWLKLVYGIDGKSNYWQDSKNKSSRIDWLSDERDVSLRYILETLGTEWGRNLIVKDLWLKIATLNFCTFENGMIVRDVRFSNEVDWLDNLGGILVHSV